MGINEKLMLVQSELVCPKDLYNAFGKYKYRSTESIIEAVKPLLKENGLILNISDEIVQIGDRFYVRATATLTDTETNEKVETSAFAREDLNKKGMDLAQVTGSTSSYARKYALNGLLAIDDTKDSDSTNTHEKGQNDTNKSILSEAQIKRLYAIAKSAGVEAEKVKSQVKKAFGVEIKQLTKTQYDRVCKGYEENKNK